MVQTGRPLSEVGRRFDPLPQILENVRFTGTPPLEEASVIKAVQAGEARLGNTGRILMRKSGTEPLIRVMAEGEDADLVQGVVSDIVTAIEHASAGLEI
jgi:phosphoglucosamine mutase